MTGVAIRVRIGASLIPGQGDVIGPSGDVIENVKVIAAFTADDGVACRAPGQARVERVAIVATIEVIARVGVVAIERIVASFTKYSGGVAM